jgi:RHS repeat-associated core domain
MEDELEQRAADYLISVLGFNGERIDPVLGGYHLGNGYRLYSPALRRFISPDSMSPFGQGGINPYAYCEGDPINNTDPTGHFGIFGAIITAGMLAADLLTEGLASAAETGVLLAREGGLIAAQEAAQTGSKAIDLQAVSKGQHAITPKETLRKNVQALHVKLGSPAQICYEKSLLVGQADNALPLKTRNAVLSSMKHRGTGSNYTLRYK